MGRSRAVHQVDGGGAVGRFHRSPAVVRWAGALPGAENGFSSLQHLVDADVAHHDQVGVGGAIVAAVLAQHVITGQGPDGIFGARQRMTISRVTFEHQARHQLIGHGVGFVFTPAELGQVLSADTLQLMVGEVGVQHQVGGELQCGGPMLGKGFRREQGVLAAPVR